MSLSSSHRLHKRPPNSGLTGGHRCPWAGDNHVACLPGLQSLWTLAGHHVATTSQVPPSSMTKRIMLGSSCLSTDWGQNPSVHGHFRIPGFGSPGVGVDTHTWSTDSAMNTVWAPQYSSCWPFPGSLSWSSRVVLN